MDPKFVPSKIIESAPVGPLYTYIEPYIAFVSELGFAPRSVYEQIRVIVMFSRSLLRSGCEICDLDESVTERFLDDENKCTSFTGLRGASNVWASSGPVALCNEEII